jgi:hypothetical protein
VSDLARNYAEERVRVRQVDLFKGTTAWEVSHFELRKKMSPLMHQLPERNLEHNCRSHGRDLAGVKCVVPANRLV